MGIIGSIGSAVGSAAGSVGRVAGGVGRSAGFGGAIRGGIEGGGGGPIGGSSISGLARFDIGRSFGRAGPVNEGPVGLAALKLTVPLGEIKFNGKPAVVPGGLIGAESILSQAKKPAINSVPLLSLRDPAFGGAKQSRLEYNLIQIAASSDFRRSPRNDELIEPMFRPFVVTAASPALEPTVKADPQIETGVANETEPVAAVQPVLQKEQKVEEVVTERTTNKQIDIVREEIEKFKLKVVIDEEVLGNRLVGLIGAAEVVEAKSEGGEIAGNKIVEIAPAETEDKRSGIIKKQGPDGSWVETLEEIASSKFRSLAETKEQIVAIITRKVPVKRAKEGKRVEYEAVARVLKYRKRRWFAQFLIK